MKCTYPDSGGCLHYKQGECDMETCYDEYSISRGEPFPNKEVEAYWVGLIGRDEIDRLHLKDEERNEG